MRFLSNGILGGCGVADDWLSQSSNEQRSPHTRAGTDKEHRSSCVMELMDKAFERFSGSAIHERHFAKVENEDLRTLADAIQYGADGGGRPEEEGAADTVDHCIAIERMRRKPLAACPSCQPYPR